MAKLEDLIEEYREQGREDDAALLEQMTGSTLRKKAQNAEKLETENADLKTKLAAMEAAPLRDKAFKDYGINLSELTKAERKVLESYEGELESEDIGKFVEEWDLPTVSEDGTEEGDQPQAAQVAAAARRAPHGGKSSASLTTADVADWDAARWMRFEEEHPEEAELLLQGKPVVGVTG